MNVFYAMQSNIPQQHFRCLFIPFVDCRVCFREQMGLLLLLQLLCSCCGLSTHKYWSKNSTFSYKYLTKNSSNQISCIKKNEATTPSETRINWLLCSLVRVYPFDQNCWMSASLFVHLHNKCMSYVRYLRCSEISRKQRQCEKQHTHFWAFFLYLFISFFHFHPSFNFHHHSLQFANDKPSIEGK